MDSNTTMPALLTQPAVLAEEPSPEKKSALFILVGALAIVALLYLVFLR
jgi:uncharacterized protein involved in exopolysaccharide biosynthesis